MDKLGITNQKDVESSDKNKNRKDIEHSIQTIWKCRSCEEDCFFFYNQTKGFNGKNKNKTVYIIFASVSTPILAARNNGKLNSGGVTGEIEPMEIDQESVIGLESEIDDQNRSETNHSNHQKIVSYIFGIIVPIK